MKIRLLKIKLEEILDIVANICLKKNDLNILNNFLLTASDNKVEILATDLEINYQTKFEAQIEKKGKVLIPAKLFQKIINNFYDDEVILEKKNNNLEIKGEGIFANISSLTEEEYPIFSEIQKDKFIEIETEILDDYLDKLWPILTTADIRPEFNGILFHLKSNELILITTDTIRLAEVKIKPAFYQTNLEADYKVLIPKRIFQEYRRVKRKTGKLKIYIEESQVSFEINDQLFTTKLFSVEYPPYEKIKPNSFIISFDVNKKQILNAFNLNKVFMNQFKELTFNLEPQTNELKLISQNEVLGENTNVLKVNVHKNKDYIYETYSLKFNLDFLIDGFSAIDSEEVFCGFFTGISETSKPLLIKPKPETEDDFIYILMHYSS